MEKLGGRRLAFSNAGTARSGVEAAAARASDDDPVVEDLAVDVLALADGVDALAAELDHANKLVTAWSAVAVWSGRLYAARRDGDEEAIVEATAREQEAMASIAALLKHTPPGVLGATPATNVDELARRVEALEADKVKLEAELEQANGTIAAQTWCVVDSNTWISRWATLAGHRMSETPLQAVERVMVERGQPGPWLVVRKREIDPPEVWYFNDYLRALVHYDDASAQWTETWLVAVLAGPVLGTPMHTDAKRVNSFETVVMAKIRVLEAERDGLTTERDAALARLAPVQAAVGELAPCAVQATYDPGDGSAGLLLVGVDDARFRSPT